ncbi:MAG: glycosyltransferase family 4 protein, partial [Acidimicrobiales bacterium]
MLGAASPPAGSSAESLRVALLTYRGNPLCGGQGVYVHYLSRELAELGHRVKVVSGPPYPYVVPGVELVKLPSLDLYRASDPFRTPRLAELGNVVDLAEWALMCTGRFPEPLTYSLRAWRWLRPRRDELDVVHDNQCLGYGILGIARELPVVATIHHPITVDRDLELAQAPDRRRQASLRRWYGFVAMQTRVVRRLSHIITVSKSSGRDICAQMGARPEQLSVVPVGVDPDLFRPIPYIARVPGRIMTTASADVALKGLLPLLEALAKVRTERHAELVVVGQPRADGAVPSAIERLGL